MSQLLQSPVQSAPLRVCLLVVLTVALLVSLSLFLFSARGALFIGDVAVVNPNGIVSNPVLDPNGVAAGSQMDPNGVANGAGTDANGWQLGYVLTRPVWQVGLRLTPMVAHWHSAWARMATVSPSCEKTCICGNAQCLLTQYMSQQALLSSISGYDMPVMASHLARNTKLSATQMIKCEHVRAYKST